jgi:DNA modification methylase
MCIIKAQGRGLLKKGVGNMKGFLKCTKKYQNAVILANDKNVEWIKEEIRNVSNFIFVKTLDEFKENIKPDSFIAISMSADIVLTTKLMKQFPDNVFHIILEPPICWSLGDYVEVSKEKNVIRGIYLVNELINHIKKVVQLEKTSQGVSRRGVKEK